MKRYYIVIFLIFFVILSVLSVYKAVTPQNYNSNGISFDYPGTWIKISPNQSYFSNQSANSDIVALGDPNGAQNTQTTVIFQKTQKAGTLEEIVNASKAELQKDWGAVMLSENMTTVDGRPAYEVIYTFNNSGDSKKERMIILDKNDMVYTIILGGSASVFDSQKNNFDMIIKSFKVTN